MSDSHVHEHSLAQVHGAWNGNLKSRFCHVTASITFHKVTTFSVLRARACRLVQHTTLGSDPSHVPRTGEYSWTCVSVILDKYVDRNATNTKQCLEGHL